MNILARGGISWHTLPMNVMRKGVWRSLGCGLLWAVALNGCGILHPSSSPPAAPVATHSDVAAVNSEAVQSLQRRIRERDKRITELRSQIAELTSQMEALKVIDLEMDDQRKSSRSPATLTRP